ncbi:hypothetical protein WIN67_19165 [Pseudomonas idahonensis]|uniref:hypothetical protein n=1 Tax=Pseudomonas TaxID=286 RepID=UPI000F4A7D83|nr:hypothetical protein [Pseudomonas protegens]MDP9511625.1 hypothetical protein [Pseudomonas protegens]ROL90602.1 hypothetical protein BK639_18460 [Pseudomonas protegens]ROL98139.1 hypothetical protein BK641_28495 [Pseudomonas protegens]ROM07927.1 hypothetical protein BK642_15395 [Pseudomonas protegens]ROM12094.1 hypothetical protein BK640_03120 [Pseudomonas protegens]
MSYFMAYFEINNKQSQDYNGFTDVGNFIMPKKIYGGTILINRNGKVHKASIITDLSKQSANDYFLKRGTSARSELINFIVERTKNNSIISCVVGYIDTGQTTIFPKEHERINLESFPYIFDKKPCVEKCLEIVC